MNYTLITTKGKVYTFYIQGLAATYQQAYGGVLVTNDILAQDTNTTTVGATAQ